MNKVYSLQKTVCRKAKVCFWFLSCFLLLVSSEKLPQAQAIPNNLTLPALQDSSIVQDKPTSNYGAVNNVKVQSLSAKNRRTLLQFDLSTIPTSSTVQSAFLELYATTPPGASRSYEVYPLTNSWQEGTGSKGGGTVNSPSVDGVTWIERRYGDNIWTGSGLYDWQTQGGDYQVPSVDTTTTPSLPDWMRWNIASIVQSWVDGTIPNYGLIIKDTTEEEALQYTGTFASREHANSTIHPRLIIVYLNANTSLSITSIDPLEWLSLTVTITNIGGSGGDQIHAASFNIPGGFHHIPTTDTSYTVTPPSGKTWLLTGLPSSPDGTQTVTLTASTDADDLADGESLQITFTLMSPKKAGDTFWESSTTGAAGGVHYPAPQQFTTNFVGDLFLGSGGNQSLNSVTLTASDQTTTGSLGTLTTKDLRDSGNGWNVVVSSTDFQEINNPLKTIPSTGLNIPFAPTVTTICGNDPPLSYSGNLSAPGLKLLSATLNTGMGAYQTTPELTLQIPAQTFAGTYTATITETILSGP